MEWLDAILQSKCPDQSDDSEEMIGVEMREENFRECETHSVPHHLALRPLATLEQDRFAFAHQRDGRAVPLDSRSSGCGT
jgi:hypothetical protein